MRSVLRLSPPPARALGLTPLLLSVLLGSSVGQGCARRQSSSEPLIGVTRAGENDEEEEQRAPTPEGETDSAEALPLRDPIAEEQERELALASAALSRVEAEPEFQVAFTVVERASDLPWILAIENRAQEPLELAADPSLLRFEVTPPEGDAPTTSSKNKTASAPTPRRCGGDSLPKTSSAERRLLLAPGEILTYAFDPRQLCDDASVLKEGASIRASYGWPVETKKVWSGGKMTEVELEARAPFVARRPGPEPAVPRTPAPPKNDETPPAGLKVLTSAPFVLGDTYPLEEVALFPEDFVAPSSSGAAGPDAPLEDSAEDAASNDASASGAARPSAPPPPPLALVVKPLGKTKSPEEATVTVTVKNQSPKSVSVFLRRELLVYEVVGPWGATTCRMHPQMRAPDSASFDTLGAGASRSLVTRLAEACPSSTFAAPGTYSVSARLEARERGREYGLDAFAGDVRSKEPARFEVTGSKPAPIPPQFRVTPGGAKAGSSNESTGTAEGAASPPEGSPAGAADDAAPPSEP